MIDTVGGVDGTEVGEPVRAVRAFCPLGVPTVALAEGVEHRLIVTQNAAEAVYGRAERTRHRDWLRQLAEAVDSGVLGLQVLLRTTPLPRPLPGGFAIYTLSGPAGPDLVLADTAVAAVPFMDPTAVELYEALWTDLADAALDGQASAKWLADGLAWRL